MLTFPETDFALLGKLPRNPESFKPLPGSNCAYCQEYTLIIHTQRMRWTHMAHLGFPEREEATSLLLPRATSCI